MSYDYALKLKKLCESAPSRVVAERFGEAIRTKQFDPYSITVPQIADAFLGRDYSRKSSILNAIATGNTLALESTEAVDASAFSNITGQLLVTIIKEKYEDPMFVGDQLCRTIPNPGSNLKTHIVPYLSDVIDQPGVLEQGQPYPQTRFSESYVTLPAPQKRGEICALTLEMVYSDLTGQAQDSAASVGRALRYGKEVRQMRVILGVDNPYVWNGNSINTYLATAGTGNYANKLVSSTLASYSQVNDVEQMFQKMSDPITGRRIYVGADTVLCFPAKYYDVKRILGAKEVRDATTGIHNVTDNPIEQDYKIVKSSVAEELLLASPQSVAASDIKQRLFWGNFKKAFVYREVYPLKVEQAPANNAMQFNQDIVVAVKASEFGVMCVFDPRYVIFATAEVS